VFVYEMTDGEPVPFPELTEAQKNAYARMLDRGREILTLGGQFQWDPEAKEFFRGWYIHNQKHLPGDPNTRFYHKTKWVQMLKVATLLSVSCENTLVLRKLHLDAALAIFEKTEVNLNRVFQGIGRNELSAVSNKVVEILAANSGPMLEKQLKTVLFAHAGGREQYEILEHLVAAEKVFLADQEINGANDVKITRRWVMLPEHVEQAKEKGIVKK
jgi:hypothetical protein